MEDNQTRRSSFGCGTPGYQAPEMTTSTQSPQYSYPIDIYALGQTIKALYPGNDLDILQIILKMISKNPEDRGDVKYWCSHPLFNIIPSSASIIDIIPVRERYPEVFTIERLTDGKLELELCQGGIMNKKVSFPFIKRLQEENQLLKMSKRKREEEESESQNKKPCLTLGIFFFCLAMTS
jgi:serine/threonine protein kinase